MSQILGDLRHMENSAPSLKIFSAQSFQLQSSIMANTGRFQELSPTKIQEILDNVVPEKNEESHKVRNKHI